MDTEKHEKALLVVDMQVIPFIWKDYGGKSIFEEDRLLRNIGQLIEGARKAGVPVYYILYTEGEGSPRSEGQPLWQVHPQIAPQDTERTIIKYHADSFLKTELHQLLQQDDADTVVICGVQTEFYVDTTVKSTYSHGYHVVLAKDGHSTYNSDLLPAEMIIARFAIRGFSHLSVFFSLLPPAALSAFFAWKSDACRCCTYIRQLRSRTGAPIYQSTPGNNNLP